MIIKYLIKFQNYEDIDFYWFETKESLKTELSKYYDIVAYGKGINTIGKKLNVKNDLKKQLGKRPVYIKSKEVCCDSSITSSGIYDRRVSTKEDVELSQILWDNQKKMIDTLIKKL
jgi:hypothetical protein